MFRPKHGTTWRDVRRFRAHHTVRILSRSIQSYLDGFLLIEHLECGHQYETQDWDADDDHELPKHRRCKQCAEQELLLRKEKAAAANSGLGQPDAKVKRSFPQTAPSRKPPVRDSGHADLPDVSELQDRARRRRRL